MRRFLAFQRTTLFYLILGVGLAGCARCSKKPGDEGSSGGNASEQATTPGGKISTAPAHAAYVTNNGSDSISVLDREGTTVDTIALDLDHDAHEAPHHLAIDSASKRVFVALAFPPTVKPGKTSPGGQPGRNRDPHGTHGNATDVGKLARLHLANLAITTTRDVDENPGDVVLTHDRARVLVTHFDMKRAMDVAAKGGGSPSTMFAHLAVFDASTMTKLGSRAVCVAPHGVVTTKDDKTAFVACYGSDELGIVDLASEGFPVSRIPLGSSPGVPGVPRYGPYSATLSPDEKLVVVADLEGNDLRVFDRATRKFVADKTVTVSAKAFMPSFVDDHTLLVPLQSPDGIVKVDLDQAKVVKRGSFDRDKCKLPHVVRVGKDGRVYLVCEGDHVGNGTVLELDKDTLETKRSWTVGVYPDGLAFGDE